MNKLISILIGSAVASTCNEASVKVWFHVGAKKSFGNLWPKFGPTIKDFVKDMKRTYKSVDYGVTLFSNRILDQDVKCYSPVVNFETPGSEEARFKMIDEYFVPEKTTPNNVHMYGDVYSGILPVAHHFNKKAKKANEHRFLVILTDYAGIYTNKTFGYNNTSICAGSKRVIPDVTKDVVDCDKKCEIQYPYLTDIFEPLQKGQIHLIANVRDGDSLAEPPKDQPTSALAHFEYVFNQGRGMNYTQTTHLFRTVDADLSKVQKAVAEVVDKNCNIECESEDCGNAVVLRLHDRPKRLRVAVKQ